MTFIYELDLVILKVYPHTKMNFLGQGFQQLERYGQTDRQTDGHIHICVQKHNDATFARVNKPLK